MVALRFDVAVKWFIVNVCEPTCEGETVLRIDVTHLSHVLNIIHLYLCIEIN